MSAEPTLPSPVGPIPVLSPSRSVADVIGAWRVRWGMGRFAYRVEPGLYAVGRPDERSPVLVTANYKLSLDALRFELGGRSAWILVLDTHGINVWCAAGKGTFGTDELVHRIEASRLSEVVSHRKLVLPQLGAPGVAAHQVKERAGFRVIWGPVQARDLPAFLDDRMRASAAMRRVDFPLRDRAVLTSMEFVGALKLLAPVALVLIALRWGSPEPWWQGLLPVGVGLAAGTVLTPLLLPWLPGRAFAFKGAVAGAVAVGAAVALIHGGVPPLVGWADLFLGTAVASFLGMGFTGASTFTSPTGVETEMRKALPLQLAAAMLGLSLHLTSSLL